MSLIKYIDRKFGADALKTIAQVNRVLQEYEAQGYLLTLRQ